MANREHFLLLFRSIAAGDCRAWNDWRIDHPMFLPELTALELWGINLPFINLSKSDLRLANLREVNFYRASFENSDLSMAILKNANLREANMKNAKLYHANLRGADLRRANLTGADLRQVDLTGAWLKDANLLDAVIDADAFEQFEILVEEGVSRIERIALRLSRHRRSKLIHPAVVKARRAVKVS
jgi:hypothetical protein